MKIYDILKIVSKKRERDTNKKCYNKFMNAGEYLVEGFAKGTNENTLKDKVRARVMAKAAYDAINIVRDTDNYGHNVNNCISCGDIIPEGFQVCKACIARVNNK